MQDDKLLTQYARDGSEAAFSQLIARHLTLVYRTCRRELGSPALAEDAAQVVFLLLARKARSLHAGPSLAGWLYQTAVFVAKDVRKQEARRQLREQTVMQEALHTQTAPNPEWDSIEPLLNNALSALKPTDREAVLLRFLEGHTLAETGTLLGLTEDAARMRVTRAVEKLRIYLTAHGASVTSTILTSLLTSEAVHPVSVHAATVITQWTLQSLSTGPAANVLLLSKGVSHTMKIIKVKYAALAAVVLLTGAAVPPLVHALSPNKGALPTVHRVSPQLTSGDWYANRQPPALESLILPNAEQWGSALAGGDPHASSGEGNMHVVTLRSLLSFKTVCQFYTDKLLPPGSKLEAMGVQGGFKKQSGYSLDVRQDVSAATFSQRTVSYSISVSIYRGIQDKATAVTLVYGQS